MQTSALIRVRVRDIGPGYDNLVITGIIIRTQDVRTVKVKRDNSEKSVWSFTIRDSPSDFINVSAWGTAAYIKSISEQFHILDAVDLVNVKAVFRKENDQYHPAINSSFKISLGEKSHIKLCTNTQLLAECKALSFVPSKPDFNFLTINDIHRNGKTLQGQFVNFLAAVFDVGETKEFTTKTGKISKCRDVKLIDESYSTLLLTIWDSDLQTLSEQWVAKQTVLFVADVRVVLNKFRKLTTSTTGRTVITVDPLTGPAKNLQEFLFSSTFQECENKIDQIENKYPNPYTINTISSCLGVIVKAKDENCNDEFTVLVHALINDFDIDTGSDSFIITKCKRCNITIYKNDVELCPNSDCTVGIDSVYDIRISLMDHTGTLTMCKLPNFIAERLMDCKASEFRNLSLEEKTTIKWKYLLKYCAVRLAVVPLRDKRSPLITVICIDLVPISKYSTFIPMC